MADSTATINVCNDCNGTLCATCACCVECVPGHDDGYGGELHYVIDTLHTLMDTHECNPSPHHAAIAALFDEAESALSSALSITSHQ